MSEVYKSDILGAVHQAVEGLQKVGAIDKKTMREFDESCLTEIKPMSPNKIVKLRNREGISQAVMGRYMNVAAKLIGEWERGEKKPSSPSLKLLSMIDKKGVEILEV